MAELRKSFRPEFLNRIDETILFKPLTLEEITKIVDLLLADLNKRLADRRVTVRLDKKAHDWAAERGYDPVFLRPPVETFPAAEYRNQAGSGVAFGGSRGEVRPRIHDTRQSTDIQETGYGGGVIGRFHSAAFSSSPRFYFGTIHSGLSAATLLHHSAHWLRTSAQITNGRQMPSRAYRVVRPPASWHCWKTTALQGTASRPSTIDRHRPRHYHAGMDQSPRAAVRVCLVALTLALIQLSVLGREAPSAYSITFVQTSAGEPVSLTAINNRGDVCGNIFTSDGVQRAVMRTADGKFQFVGVAGTSATAINDKGQVVGNYSVILNGIQTVRAFFWDNGKFTDLDSLGMAGTPFWTKTGSLIQAYSSATSINNSGIVVGQTARNYDVTDYSKGTPLFPTYLQDYRAFSYGAKMIDLGALYITKISGIDWGSSMAISVNDYGVVVGTSGISTSLDPGLLGAGPTRVFMAGTAGGMTDVLPSSDPKFIAVPIKVNNRGHVVGTCGVNTNNGLNGYSGMGSPRIFFISEKGVNRQLLGRNAYALGLNDQGDILACYADDAGNMLPQAFVLTDGDPASLKMIRITDFGDTNFPLYFSAIGTGSIYNHSGQIVTGSFILTPTADLELLEPDRSQIVDGYLSANPANLAVGGRRVVGAAVDGATQLIIRVKLPASRNIAAISVESGDPADGSVKLNAEGRGYDSATGRFGFGFYSPPRLFDRERSDDTTLQKRSATLITTLDNGTTIKTPLELWRPPVLLIHGLWSNRETWDGLPMLGDPRFANGLVYRPDYSDIAAGHPAVVAESRYQSWVKTALTYLWRRDIAAKRVDVVGHSMGGLISRAYNQSARNWRDDNFYRGDINRLITVNTPHLGSEWATFLMKPSNQDSPAFRRFMESNFGAIDQGAIEDLAVGSDFQRSLLGTLQTHTIAGTGGSTIVNTNGLAYVWPKLGALYAMLDLNAGNSTKDIFGSEKHDFVVGLGSQRGGIADSAQDTFGHTDSIHTHCTKDPIYSDRITKLLSAPNLDDFAMAPPPYGRVLRSQEPVRAALQAPPVAAVSDAQLTLAVGSAASGPGGKVSVVVTPSAGLSLRQLVIMTSRDAVTLTPPVLTTSLDLPSDIAGRYDLQTFGRSSGDAIVRSEVVSVNIVPTGSLRRITIADSPVSLDVVGQKRALSLTGTYSDGRSYKLVPGFPITFTSNSPSIASVDREGTLTAAMPGIAIVTCVAGDVSLSVPVVVNAPPNYTPAATAITPRIVTQPAPQLASVGGPVVFKVEAVGPGSLEYQWRRDGVAIANATSATLTVQSVGAGEAGAYSVVIRNAVGTVTSESATLSLKDVGGRIINLSILSELSQNEVLRIGTVVGPASSVGNKPVLIRAVGPSLAVLGVTNWLPDPAVTLTRSTGSGSTAIASNDNWGGDSAKAAMIARVGAFGFASANSKDAAIALEGNAALAPGGYVAEVIDSDGRVGTVLAELYDATPSDSARLSTPRLTNVSVLKSMRAGTSLTCGIVIGGTTSRTVVVRAVGPTLGAAPFGLTGVLADPKMECFNNATGRKFAENDDWGGSTTLAEIFRVVGAFPLAAANSKDAVLVGTLEPGAYSVRVSGAQDTGGVVLVEVYEVP